MKQMAVRNRFKFKESKSDHAQIETNQLRKRETRQSKIKLPRILSRRRDHQVEHRPEHRPEYRQEYRQSQQQDNVLRSSKSKTQLNNRSEAEETRPQNRPVDTKGYAQFLSVFFIISTLFGIVFFHMEIRRLGYTILTLSQEEKQERDKLRTQIVSLAKVTGPERIQNVAQTRFPLKRAEPGQIIQMTQQGHAVTQ